MTKFRYSTDIDGGNDLTNFSIEFEAVDVSAAWHVGNKAMDQLGINQIDRVNPKIEVKSATHSGAWVRIS